MAIRNRSVAGQKQNWNPSPNQPHSKAAFPVPLPFSSFVVYHLTKMLSDWLLDEAH